MAQVNLGSIKFKWKGIYAGSTAYTIDDVVSYNGSSYICIQASTGNLPTDTTYFEQMSSAGTNGTDGTDLTTTLTTQGDLVYRDGSGLARLGAGTAGQVLQSGGTGANVSWTDVSGGDVVKLASATDINTTTYSVDGYFSSEYTHYKLVFSTVRSSNQGSMFLRINIGGSQHTSSQYRYAVSNLYRDSGSTVLNSPVSGWNDTSMRYNADDHGNSGTGSLVVTVDDPLTTNGLKNITTDFNYQRGFDNNTIQRNLGGCIVNTYTAMSGFSFFTQSGNFKADHFAMYGFKA
jgi:hypothetical protein